MYQSAVETLYILFNLEFGDEKFTKWYDFRAAKCILSYNEIQYAYVYRGYFLQIENRRNCAIILTNMQYKKFKHMQILQLKVLFEQLCHQIREKHICRFSLSWAEQV